MGYESIDILRSYKTNKHDIIHEFYIPVLKESVLYKRAVGFFSSSALIQLSRGISGLIRNDGHIKFIVSPRLSEEDIDAIQKGYNEREVINNTLLREFREPQNIFDKERLNWLAHLIATDSLEIKVAFTPPNKVTGMYHEKIGILHDNNGNRIAFTGSMNETINAFHNNYESIVAFNSLVSEDLHRVNDLESDFDSLWNDKEPNIEVIEFPHIVRDKLLSYKEDNINLDIDNFDTEEVSELIDLNVDIPLVPHDVTLHEYQIEAIDNWVKHDYRGIFDMATGTGKTYTGLAAASRLFSDKKRLAIIIVCPYQHLVEQWVEDIVKFNMNPIIGYSASAQTNWKKKLSEDIMDFRLSVIDSFCFVTTNATYSSEYVQNQLDKLGASTLLIVDEAHNFGATKLSKTLNPKIEYRLALSATLERHGDAVGTKVLYDYFGVKCIEYNLERAIRENKLTPYYYFPKVVLLTEDELYTYSTLSKEIAKQYHENKNGIRELTEYGQKLLIKRARIVAGASNKVHLLRSLIEGYKNDTHILIYCGAARSNDFSDDNSSKDTEGERQIVSVSKMLGFDLGMKVTHFTSAESSSERERIKRQFADADPYQAIVAIKCLDEGVNIPSIKTAFILASSTNPKEYVQRRGRVLRKAENKPYATIYDFITLPTPIDYVDKTGEEARLVRSLIKKEISRMKEFGEIALNPSEADKLVKELEEAYGLDILTIDQEEECIDE